MGRPRRISFPGAFFHALNRGNHREPVFLDDQDYRQMLHVLGAACERYRVRIHGYCLMPNHFHLLIQQQDLSISLAMRSFETAYATYFNQRYHKSGHVFQGRYRGILCDQKAYLMELIRYIHLNPVRARLVGKPHEWPWSSLPAYLGLSQNPWLYQLEVLVLLGQQPQKRLLEFLSQAPDLMPAQIYPAESLSILGGATFIQKVSQAGEPRRKRRRVYMGRRLSLLKLAEILGRVGGMTPAALCVPGKGSQTLSHIREQLVHVANRILFYPEAEIARFLGISTASVTRANHRFEAKSRKNGGIENEMLSLLMENK
jgi:putative transposase